MEHERQLVALLRGQPWLMEALGAGRALGLSSWAIGAGAIRSLVWDRLCGHARPTPIPDIDLVYFDPADLSPEREHQLEAQLRTALPSLNWEVCNQAAVHLWREQEPGRPLPPLQSLADGVASWPETATSVAAWLDEEDRVRILAPCGLDDLMNGVLRHNPRHGNAAVFERRLMDKQFLQRWPALRRPPARDYTPPK